MIRFLVAFKRRHPRIWVFVEWLNGLFFRVLYGKTAKCTESVLASYSPAGCGFSTVQEGDLAELGSFLAGQDKSNLRWFNPHPFNSETLGRLYRNPSFVMMKVTGPSGEIVGYFFLRCFFIGRAFAGLIVDPEWQNKGIGSEIWKAESEICARAHLKMRATLSRDNKSSVVSCHNGTSVRKLQELGDGYLAIECKQKNDKS